MWREIRGDRLEAQVLGDLFAVAKIEDAEQREQARAAAFRQLATVLRYQARLGRELEAARASLHALRQRRLGVQPPVRNEPAPHRAAADDAVVPDEPERPLNRHQRRALAAIARKRAA
jgi:hypothetical protein